MDTEICLEFMVQTEEENFPVIYRPKNLNELLTMVNGDLVQEIKEEYKALSCVLNHIYINGRSADEKFDVEFSIGNKEEFDIEMHLLET